MLVMFLGRTSEDKDVVIVSKTEIQVFENLVHKNLEGLGSVSRSKDIKRNSKRLKGLVIAVFWLSSAWTGI